VTLSILRLFYTTFSVLHLKISVILLDFSTISPCMNVDTGILKFNVIYAVKSQVMLFVIYVLQNTDCGCA